MAKDLKERIKEKFESLTEQEKTEFIKKEKVINIFLCCISSLVCIGVSIFLLLTISPEDSISVRLVNYGGVVILMAFNIGVLIWIISYLKGPQEKLIETRIKRLIVNDIQGNFEYEISKQIFQINPEFKISKIVELKYCLLEKSFIIIDSDKRLIVFIINSNFSKVYNFKDINGYEIYENGSSVVQGTVGQSLVGGIFFGLGGAIIGGNTSRRIENYCGKLELIIRLNDIDLPQIKISYITTKVDKNSATYSNLRNKLQEICSIMEFIINNKNLEEYAQIAYQVKEEQRSTKDQMIEIKEMLDEGLITQEEFDQKKKQILNL